ncbi:hypothetical protein ONZ45_g10075 [Pleurotus djamor]|nr:hypothetical protein ONZ45_g10075 [Pleurotus djamor]
MRLVTVDAELGLNRLRSLDDLYLGAVLGKLSFDKTFVDLSMSRIAVPAISLFMHVDLDPQFTIIYRKNRGDTWDHFGILPQRAALPRADKRRFVVIKHTKNLRPLDISHTELYFIELLVKSFIKSRYYTGRTRRLPSACNLEPLVHRASSGPRWLLSVPNFAVELSEMVLEATPLSGLRQLTKVSSHAAVAVRSFFHGRIVRLLRHFLDVSVLHDFFAILHSPYAVIVGDLAFRILRGSERPPTLMEIACSPLHTTRVINLLLGEGYVKSLPNRSAETTTLIRQSVYDDVLKRVIIYESNKLYPASVALEMGVSSLACAVSATAIYDFFPDLQLMNACIYDGARTLTLEHEQSLADKDFRIFKNGYKLTNLDKQEVACGRACPGLWRRASPQGGGTQALAWGGLQLPISGQTSHATYPRFCSCEGEFMAKNHISWRVTGTCCNQWCSWEIDDLDG